MKKIFIAVIMMFVLIISNGCEKTTANNIKEIKNLVQQEIFTQEDQRYYIFFYRDNCGDCEKAKPFVLDYVEASKTNDELIPLYGVNLSDPLNKSMYRRFSGKGGQGTGETCSGLFKVDNVTKWDNLYIGCTASIILIYTYNDVKTAKFRANGKDNIKKLLEIE